MSDHLVHVSEESLENEIPKYSRDDLANEVNDLEDVDEGEGEGEDEAEHHVGDKRKHDVDRFDGVTMNTVLRWKQRGKINVDCFLGFSDSSSDVDKLKGAEILQNMGHFYCVLCGTYVRGNKKSVARHQARNRKHLSLLSELPGQTFVPNPAHSYIPTINTALSPFNKLKSAKGHELTEIHGSYVLQPNEEAWEILNNPKKVANIPVLQEILGSLGICDAKDLLLCHDNEINQLATILKAIPQRRFIQILLPNMLQNNVNVNVNGTGGLVVANMTGNPNNIMHHNNHNSMNNGGGGDDKPIFGESDDEEDDERDYSNMKGTYDVDDDDEDNEDDLENEDIDEEEGENGDELPERESPIATKIGSKRSLLDSGAKSSKKKRKKKEKRYNIFEDEASEADDEDEEEEYEYREQQEVIVGEDERRAIEAVEKRQLRAKEMFEMDATEIAKAYEEKSKRQTKYEKLHEYGEVGLSGGPRMSTVTQQSFLPGVHDPSIWRVKVKTGMETLLVLSIMRKAIDSRNRGGPLRIKSAFSNGSKGYIYIEAIAEPLARESIAGLRGIYQSSLTKVAIKEMTAVVTITKTKNPLIIGQWVRIKRGPLKGDLARIVDIFEGGLRVMIQAVPRPDYTNTTTTTTDGIISTNKDLKIRPPKRLFDPIEVRNNNGECFRKYHPLDKNNEKYDFWNNEYYKNGYLYKDVKVSTYIHTDNVIPTIEESKLFVDMKKKTKSSFNEYDDEEHEEQEEDEEIDEFGNPKPRSYIAAIAEQLKGTESSTASTEKVSPFVIGDLVQVISGELSNLVAKITSINVLNKTVTATPYNSALTEEMNIEMSILTKYIPAGSHIKVINGPYLGQTGRVVCSKIMDGKPTAVILADGMNTEIFSDLNHLQISSEITAGLGNLMGYELYDLIVLNENESAVIIGVGTEKVQVINHMDLVKEIYPQEIQSKRNLQSQKSFGADSQQNKVYVGDVVNVTSGTHAKRSGTIKHIMKGSFWLHSNLYLKNSGIFVIRGRCCVVAGSKSTNTVSAASTPAVTFGKPQRRMGKDEAVGKTIRIKKGQYKGLLAQIVDVINDSYSVELLAKMKKIIIEKSKTVIVGDKEGSIISEDRTLGSIYEGGVPSTPFYSQETPHHLYGAATPHYYTGSETPGYEGGMTPGRTPNPYANSDEDLQVWSLQANIDNNPITTATSGNGYNTNLSTNISSNIQSPASYGRANDLPNSSPWLMSDTTKSPYSAYSPHPGSMYSPSIAPSTPSSTYGGGGSSSSNQVTYLDWVPNMIVVFKSGSYIGRYGIVCEVPRDNEIRVQLRHDKGHTVGNIFSVRPNEVSIAEPPGDKKAKIYVLGGQYKGKYGTVKKIVGKDIIVESEQSLKPEMYKLNLVAWMNK